MQRTTEPSEEGVRTEQLESSYRFCREIVVRSRSSFAKSMSILPFEQRRALETLYAFMRTVDDIADDESVSSEERRERLKRWRTWRNQNSPLVPALIQTIDKYSIPADCLTETITGVEQDIEFQPLNDWADLDQYCGRVAGTVGQACVCIWGTASPLVSQSDLAFWIQQQSCAIQLTNIIRDIVEDAQRGRCYLPVSLLSERGISVTEFIEGTIRLSNDALQKRRTGESQSPAPDGRLTLTLFQSLLQTVLTRTEQGYAASRPLQESLSPIGQRSNHLIRGVYGKLFQKIRQNPNQILLGRVRLNWLEKLLTVLSW